MVKRKREGKKNEYLRDIVDVAEAIKRAYDNGVKVNFLIGAGCSVSGGIPVANKLVEEVKKIYPNEVKYCNSEEYSDIMEMITASERRMLIKKYVDNANVNWSHLLIAQLLKVGYINCVITTNFDNLLLRASAMVNHFPAIYDLAAAKEFQSELFLENAIVHLHGQHTGFILCNTKEELKEQKKVIEKVFFELNKNSLWIVLGYSGESDPIAQIFKENKNSYNRLYWIGYEDYEISKKVEPLFKNKARYCYYVKGYDADSFMIKLAKHLKNYPPLIIEKPFSHLQELIDNIAELNIKDDHQQILGEEPKGKLKIIREFVDRAITKIENNLELKVRYYYDLEMFEKLKEYKKEFSEDCEVSEKIKLLEKEIFNEQFDIKNIEKNLIKWIEKVKIEELAEDIPAAETKMFLMEIITGEKKEVSLFKKLCDKLEESNDINIKKYKINVLEKLLIYMINLEDDSERKLKEGDLYIRKLLESISSLYIRPDNKEFLLRKNINALKMKFELYRNIDPNISLKTCDERLQIVLNNKDMNHYEYSYIIVLLDKLDISGDVEIIPKLIELVNTHINLNKDDKEYWYNTSKIFKNLIYLCNKENVIDDKNIFIELIKNITVKNKIIITNRNLLRALLIAISNCGFAIDDDMLISMKKELLKTLSGITSVPQDSYELNEGIASELNALAYEFIKYSKYHNLLKEFSELSIKFIRTFYNEITFAVYRLHKDDDINEFEKTITKVMENINDKKYNIDYEEYNIDLLIKAIEQNKYYQIGIYYKYKMEDLENALKNYEKAKLIKEIEGHQNIYSQVISEISLLEEEEFVKHKNIQNNQLDFKEENGINVQKYDIIK